MFALDAEAPQGKTDRAALRCTSPLELAVEHWLKTPSTGSRNDANDPHGCRGTIAQLACMWTIARPAPHRVHRQCNRGIDEDACWQHWARYSTRVSDSPSPSRHRTLRRKPPLTAWSQCQGLDHMTAAH